MQSLIGLGIIRARGMDHGVQKRYTSPLARG